MRLRHGARGHAPRLQQQDAAAIDQRRRHPRRLARARRRGQHGGAMAIERRADVVECGINGQGGRHGVSSKLTARGIRPPARRILARYGATS